jgi:hypothetical protein
VSAFSPSRDDGRSDRRVVLDLVGPEPEPGTFYAYVQLERALGQGTDRDITRRSICSAVNAANRSLLHDRKRALVVVRGAGYRIARANEHLPISLDKRRRAETFIARGLDHLRHVRDDELTENERHMHDGMLNTMTGFALALEDSHRRHDRQEGVIDRLLKRVEALEEGEH